MVRFRHAIERPVGGLCGGSCRCEACSYLPRFGHGPIKWICYSDVETLHEFTYTSTATRLQRILRKFDGFLSSAQPTSSSYT